jgi:hypothetical protein
LSNGAGLRPSPDVVARKVGDQVVLVDLRTNRFYSLNSTGARLWELIRGGSDRDLIRSQMRDEFEVDEAELVGNIDRMLSELIANGLLVDGDD